MERILISRLIVIMVCFCMLQSALGQDSYYVLRKAGSPEFQSKRQVERGSYFQKEDTLLLKKRDTVTFVNQKGKLYQLHLPLKYALNDISAHTLERENTSFNQKFFSYVWQQFSGKRKSKQAAGVVYRENRNVAMISPGDSAKLYQPDIWFRWNNKTDSTLVYFFLKDIKSDHITKMGTSSDSLLLHLDNKLLIPGQVYDWAVATTPFPSLNSLKFNRVSLLKREDYLQLQEEVNALVLTFKYLGLKENEIKEAICEYYKFCAIES